MTIKRENKSESTRARSDLWRGQQHAARAREVAYVTRAISDYCGSASGDRSYSVSWLPLDQIGASGATMTERKQIRLSSDLIAGLSAPFTGHAVDHLAGVAAHEAGHVKIAASDPWSASTHGAGAGKDNQLLAMVRNIVEDMAIDGAPGKHENPGLVALIQIVRGDMRPDQVKAIGAHWHTISKERPELSAMALLSVWGCARLFSCREILAPIKGRERESKAIAVLDPIGDLVWGGPDPLQADSTAHAIHAATQGIYLVLSAYRAEVRAINDRRDALAQERQERQEAKDQADRELAERRKEREQESESEQEPDGDPDDDTSGSATDANDPAPGESESGEPGENDSKSDPDGSPDSGSDGESDTDGDPDSDPDDESESDTDGAESGKGAASGNNADTYAGEPDTSADNSGDSWNTSGDPGALPVACPNTDSGDPLTNDDRDFWRDVRGELDTIDAQRPTERGHRDAARTLVKYIDPRVVSQIARSFDQLASEPVRRRRMDAGKIDKRRIVWASTRDDIFGQAVDRQLDGTIILLLDLSGSTRYQESLIKRIGASVYTALRPTPINCYVYTYGDPIVAQLATPDRVVNFDVVGSSGSTPMGSAFRRVVLDVQPRGVSVIINVTDGSPTDIDPWGAMRAARARGFRVINVLVGSDMYGVRRSPELVSASDSVVTLSDYATLPKVIALAVGEIVKSGKRALV